MTQTAIFWPMIVQVALIYGVYFLISKRRIEAIKAGNAKSSQFRENLIEPSESQFVRNNLTNQYELPMLFFPVCIALYVTETVSWLSVILAWMFVSSRIAHAAIHISTNRIRYRRPMFIVGWLALGALWLLFALHLSELA